MFNFEYWLVLQVLLLCKALNAENNKGIDPYLVVYLCRIASNATWGNCSFPKRLSVSSRTTSLSLSAY
jgi:hypothetical protein